MNLRFYRKFQLLSEWIWSPVGNFFIHFCSSSFLSSRSNTCLSFFQWLLRFGNLLDIDFALSCINVPAKNAQISINWNSTLIFVKFPSSYVPSVGVCINFKATHKVPRPQKSVYDQSDNSSQNHVLHSVFSVWLRFFKNSWAIFPT